MLSKYYFAGLMFCCLAITGKLSAQEWKTVYQFNPSQTCQKIRFFDHNFGITAGSLYNGSYENIHITKDGGNNWKNYNSGYTGMRFMDIFIQSEKIIYMSGNDGIIIKSTDGGETWRTLTTGTHEQIWGIQFIDVNTGVAVGSNACIIRTSDAGEHWQKIDLGISNLFYDVVFTEKGVGFASGSNVLYKSTDKGMSWHPVSFFPFQAPADWIRSIKMVDEQIGYACADIGRIYKTTDGGDTWDNLESNVEDPLFDIDFVDALRGFVCGFNGIILRTNDGGAHWEQMESPLGTENLYSIDMVNENVGFICTHTGKILKFNTISSTNTFSINVFEVFPNPVHQLLNIQFNNFNTSSLENLELMNVTGLKIAYELIKKENNNVQLQIDEKLNGICFLRFNLNGIPYSQQLYLNNSK